MSEQFDNRVVQHHLRRGTVTKAEHEAYLNSLPDDAEHAEPTETQFVASWASRSNKADTEQE